MTAEKTQIRDLQQIPFLMIPRDFFTQIQPTWKATLAYVALKYYTSVGLGKCEGVTVIELAQKVDVSEDTMQRGLKELVEKKAVRVVRKSTSGPKGNPIQHPNIYEILNIEVSTAI